MNFKDYGEDIDEVLYAPKINSDTYIGRLFNGEYLVDTERHILGEPKLDNKLFYCDEKLDYFSLEEIDELLQEY